MTLTSRLTAYNYRTILSKISRKRSDRLPHFYKDQRPIFSALLLGPNLRLSSKREGRSLIFFYRRKVNADSGKSKFISFLFHTFKNLIPKSGMWSSIRTYSCVKTRIQYVIFKSRCMPKRVFRSRYIYFDKKYKPCVTLPQYLTRLALSKKVFAYMVRDSGTVHTFLNLTTDQRCFTYSVVLSDSFSYQSVFRLANFFINVFGFSNVELIYFSDSGCYFYRLQFTSLFNNIELFLKPYLSSTFLNFFLLKK